MRAAIFVLWPSFVVGGLGEVLFFTVFDPRELYLFGEVTSLSRLAVYSIGFFLCWAFAAAASAFTYFLSRGADASYSATVEVEAEWTDTPRR